MHLETCVYDAKNILKVTADAFAQVKCIDLKSERMEPSKGIKKFRNTIIPGASPMGVSGGPEPRTFL